eukprot:6214633-Pleurochrysis_carterae.AAC.1
MDAALHHQARQEGKCQHKRVLAQMRVVGGSRQERGRFGREGTPGRSRQLSILGDSAEKLWSIC